MVKSMWVRGMLPLCASLVLIASSAAAQHGPTLFEPSTVPQTIHVSMPGLVSGAIPQDSAFNSFGCTGQNHSPRITWTGAPANTRSFALIIHDPDAPTGVGFFHWIVANLPASTTELAAGAALPAGATQGQSDFGGHDYGGPCPPAGETHRYFVTVYALDVAHLDLPPTASGAFVRFMLRGHTLALGRTSGTYRRP